MVRTTALTLAVTLVLTLATLTITPNGGSFSGSGSMPVTMQTAPSGVSIYYTTNGSTPTQSSTMYTGAMTLTSSATVKAKAFKSGSNPSAEASASFAFASVGIAKGIIRYADGSLGVTSCSNYNPSTRLCSGGSALAYGTSNGLQAANDAASAGDTIYVRGFSGRYTGSASNSVVAKNGTSISVRTRIEGYPAENAPGCAMTSTCGSVVHGFDSFQFMYILNLTVDPNSQLASRAFGSVVFSRIENVEAKNSGDIGVGSGHGFSEFINLHVHHNGWNSSNKNCPNPNGGIGECHGLYTGTSSPSDPIQAAGNLIDGGSYHHNNGYGIQCYSTCYGTTIRNVRLYRNGGGIVVQGSHGASNNNLVYNVLADNNNLVGVNLSGAGTTASNITAYNNHGLDIWVRASSNTIKNLPSGIAVDPGVTVTTSNNITSGSASTYFVD